MYVIIFDVGLGQCIFFYPIGSEKYGLMVDCGNTNDFNPVDLLITDDLLPLDSSINKYVLNNLTLTNYDLDHFSGLPYLKTKAIIETINFPRNLSSEEIISIKKENNKNVPQSVFDVTELLKNYTNKVENHDPPYEKKCFYLKKSDFPYESIDTNKLSQVVFVTYKDTTICVPGDLTSTAWDKHLENSEFINCLKKTNVFIASHHGREDGFNEKVFSYSKPECVILSDKHIIHDTQEDMASKYAYYVNGDGVLLNANGNFRKTLTTRNDGHILITINEADRTYRTLDRL